MSSPHSHGDVAHFSLYGQPGSPPATRVKSTDWRTQPFAHPATAPWTVPLQPSQLQALLLGFQPESMDDKWFVYADGPGAEGRAKVHFHRSWTGDKCMTLEIEAVRDGGKEWARITEIAYETGEDMVAPTEEEAKSIVVEVCMWVLGMELLPGEKERGQS